MTLSCLAPAKINRELRVGSLRADGYHELDTLFHSYGETGRGRRRKYLHDELEAAPYGQKPGTFTDWEDLPGETDLLALDLALLDGGEGADTNRTVEHNVTYRWFTQRIQKSDGLMMHAA